MIEFNLVSKINDVLFSSITNHWLLPCFLDSDNSCKMAYFLNFRNKGFKPLFFLYLFPFYYKRGCVKTLINDHELT